MTKTFKKNDKKKSKQLKNRANPNDLNSFCRRRASPGQYMIFVTFLSVSLNFRKFFELRLNKDWSDYETTSLMEYPPYIVFSNTWQELVVTGALPFLVLLFCNISIYLKIRESSKHESHR